MAAPVALTLVAFLACSSVAGASPLQSRALWVNHAPTPETMAGQAELAGVRTLFVKAAEGTTAEPQFTPGLLSALSALGITVCAWTFDYGADPAGEAAAAIAAVHDGAKCLVVDAEGAYDGRYGQAQLFVRMVRRALGARFPIGLAGQAETLKHPAFPYSVFLGPGAFEADMPQIYWRDLGIAVAAAYQASLGANAIYGRGILPVGQLFNGPSALEVTSFSVTAEEFGLQGVSFFDLEAATPELLRAVQPGVMPLPLRRIQPATIRPGADGDSVVWAQELLNASGARLPVGGFFGAQTGRAVTRFQARHGLSRSGLLDPATWRRLLRLRAREPSWASGPPLSARTAN